MDNSLKFINSLIDYGIAFSLADAEDLFADIENFLYKKDFKSAGKSVVDYEVDVYGFNEGNLPYDAEGYTACLKEIYKDYPILDEYLNSLAELLIVNGIVSSTVAWSIGNIIEEDMRNGRIRSATDAVSYLSKLPTAATAVKLAEISYQLAFGEDDLDI